MERQIYTNANTLSKAKRLLNEIGLWKCQNDTTDEKLTVFGIIDKLLDDKRLPEFMVIITRDEETDWNEVNMPEVRRILGNFFEDIFGLPISSVIDMVSQLTKLKVMKLTDL